MIAKHKPFFKWSGGKRKEFSHVVEWAPEAYDTFYAPFLGGGAIWLGLAPDKSVVGDFYDEVVTFYNVIGKHGKRFIEDVNDFSDNYKKLITDNVDDTYKNLINTKLKEKQTEKAKLELKDLRKAARDQFKPAADLYYYWRDGNHTTDYDLAKRFYILRCLAYGGMLRFNSEGKFNIPYGYYKTFKKLNWTEDLQRLFDSTKFYNQGWQKTVSTATKDDFVFLDPPYTRQFKEYSADNEFGNKEHIELANWFKSKKAKAMIILNKDEFTENLYKDFIVKEYPFKYSVKYRDRLSDEDASTYHFLAINYDTEIYAKLPGTSIRQGEKNES